MLRSPLQWIPVQPKALGHTYTQAAYGRTLVGPHNVGCVFVFVFPLNFRIRYFPLKIRFHIQIWISGPLESSGGERTSFFFNHESSCGTGALGSHSHNQPIQNRTLSWKGNRRGWRRCEQRERLVQGPVVVPFGTPGVLEWYSSQWLDLRSIASISRQGM